MQSLGLAAFIGGIEWPPSSLADRFIAAFNARDEGALCALVNDAEIHPLRSALEDVGTFTDRTAAESALAAALAGPGPS